MINYLFYRFYRITIHKSTYWAKIFVSVAIAMAFFPTCLTLSKYFFGCYDQTANEGTIKLIILVVGIVIMILANFYFSSQRIKRINGKYSNESKLSGKLKLTLICLILFGIFMFGSSVVRYLINIPEC